MRALSTLLLTVLVLTSPSLRAQAEIAEAVEIFVSELNRRPVKLDEKVAAGGGAWGRLGRIASKLQLVGLATSDQVSRISLLQRLLHRAESRPDVRTAAAILSLAAAGHERDLFSSQVMVVRELGEQSLLRTRDDKVWIHIVQVARGEDRSTAGNAPVRAAAFRLLGMARDPRFRRTIEAGLLDPQDLTRLGAAEAAERSAHRSSLPALLVAVRTERHPVVAQAMIRAISRTLSRHRENIGADVIENCMTGVIGLLGRLGWRTDVAVVRLLREYPTRGAVAPTIELLRPPRARRRDGVLHAVNKYASPILAQEAWQTLRRVTGALLPKDAAAWTEFWAREEANWRPPTQKKNGGGGARRTVTRGGFFGLPVVGRNVVFIIDTSASMEVRTGNQTRLDVAKKQLLQAIQGLDRATRYRLVTFATDVTVWTKNGRRARAANDRALVELLGRIEADGRTNVYAALELVLAPGVPKLGGASRKRSDGKVDEIFLLSDGAPDGGDVTEPQRVRDLVAKMNRYQNVRIHTIYVGKGDTAKFMAQLAKENGGEFVHAR